jgi:uncharacterized protein involved in exopolysaccharide biosynthesis
MSDEPDPYMQSDQVDFAKLFLVVWNRRWWVMASIVLFTCAFAALWFFSRPIYRATTIMVPAGSEQTGLGASLAGSLGPIGGLASLAGFGLGADAVETEASLAVLRSREFTEKFIREKNLMPLLFEDAWDAKAKQWKNPADAPTLARGFKEFDSGIRTIARDKRTQLVTMTIDWHQRQQAAEWANELIARLNAEMRARAIAKSTASVGFLEQELQKTPLLGTQEAINRLIEAQIKQRMIANVTHEYAFRVVDRAMVPDRIDKIWPKGSVLFPVGLLLGGLIGVIGVLLASWLSGLSGSPSAQVRAAA